jgi:sodium transport system permease protein
MKIKNIFYVFKKELTDIIRDRRTLISMIVIPIVVIPILTLGIGAVMSIQMKKISEKEIKIGIVNKTGNYWLEDKIKQKINVRFINTDDIEGSINKKEIDIGIIIPDDLFIKLKDKITSKIKILYDFSRDTSKIAKERITTEINNLINDIIRKRLIEYGLDDNFITPIKLDYQNIATEEKMGGSILGIILPYMILILALSGATYPAIDFTAGEKERGTLETILVSPASSEEIILGKYLTVHLTSLVSSLLTLFSYIFFVGTGFLLAQEIVGIKISIPFTSILLSLLLILPVTAMFSALLLSISLFAKSTKEAQSYISPLMIIVIFPAMMSFIPGFENSIIMSIIPIANISLNLKNILIGDINIIHILLAFFSSLIYAGICLLISVKLFKNEKILFRI